jgi:hypothetical protein
MTNADKIVKALKDLRPNSQWSLTGETYEGLEWLENQTIKPTKAEIETAIANPLPEPKATIEDKLASVGLNLDDLKVALGL